MQFKSVKKYLNKLIKEAHFWQYTNITGNGNKPKLWFSSLQFGFIAVSISISYWSGEFMGKDFIGYIIAALSVFIGLFLSMNLSIYDKFQIIDFKRAQVSEIERIKLIKTKNYFKQFTTLTTYAVVISLMIIFLFSPFFFTNFFNYDVLATSIDIRKWDMVYTKLLVIITYRSIILYFMLDLIYIIMLAVTSNYAFLYGEYEGVNINKPN